MQRRRGADVWVRVDTGADATMIGITVVPNVPIGTGRETGIGTRRGTDRPAKPARGGRRCLFFPVDMTLCVKCMIARARRGGGS